MHRELRIWSHLLKKSLMEIFISCAVAVTWGEELNAQLNDKKTVKIYLNVLRNAIDI